MDSDPAGACYWIAAPDRVIDGLGAWPEGLELVERGPRISEDEGWLLVRDATAPPGLDGQAVRLLFFASSGGGPVTWQRYPAGRGPAFGRTTGEEARA